ncbi:serine hydrolase [Hymenobacter gummosus]|nr:serine hydrolase [Hymenobacter gummosus]
MNRFFAFVAFLLMAGPALAQPGNPLRRLLRRDTAAVMRRVLADPAAHRLQLIYTQIRRDAQGRPSFRSYTFRLRPREYFYPASTVKLPAAAAALEWLHFGTSMADIVVRVGMAPPGQRYTVPRRNTPLQIDSAYAGQTRVLADSTAPAGRPTIEHYIRKVLLVSDNDAFNRLYEYTGQRALNRLLRVHGYRRSRIIHRLSVGDAEPGSRYTNPFRFSIDSAGTAKTLRQPPRYNSGPLPRLRAGHYRVGRAYLQGGRRVEQSFDFSTKNNFPLREQQRVLQALLFPQAGARRQRFSLDSADYPFLRKYLSLPPRLSQYPRYDAKEYPDNYAKFLLVGGPPAALPEGVRIYNKIGQAYGFLIDNACIVDSLRGVEFMLSAVVYCNQDGVLNDDQYDYDTVGLPFLRRLGQLVYQYELTRTDERRRAQVRAYWSAPHERATP